MQGSSPEGQKCLRGNLESSAARNRAGRLPAGSSDGMRIWCRSSASAATTSAKQRRSPRRSGSFTKPIDAGHQLPRQRVGIPRRRERAPDGTRDRRSPRLRLPDDQGVHARARRQGRDAAARRIAAAPADRSPRSLADSRVRLRQRSRAPFRAGRRHRGARTGEGAGQGPVRRLHRPQGSGDPPADAVVRLSRSTPASCR